ncbi:hypothetical protein NZ698_16380 [Chryseobacterium sp. PBS4-4]|uniref:Lipoprotein n=1 Tax=Chryseobacterium edaphi TaxID=2976532 RepID=A0ABT2W9W4_9FLAO|nr:hypothetical protein [Chryseobacterium edaphi]MCU7618773.1 hypothetical protein [Chryseobacterium edaphi]
MMKKKFLLSIIFLIILLSFYCKQNMSPSSKAKEQNIDSILGNSILAKENYFNLIVGKEGDIILKKQNKEYFDKYSELKDEKNFYISQNSLSIIFEKEKLTHKDNIKINLFTVVGNKKIDSVQFYRNISGNGFGMYNCMSYFNPKTNKIWQIQYFPLNPLRGNSVGIISYTESSITSDGHIRIDSLHYLDESLDAEMEKYSLYY